MGDELAEPQDAVPSLRRGDRVPLLDVEQRGLVVCCHASKPGVELRQRRWLRAAPPDAGDERAGLPAARLVEAGTGACRVVGLVFVNEVCLARVKPRLGLGVQCAVVVLARYVGLKHARRLEPVSTY